MALITCSECGKEISDKAKVCPNCGAPISNIQSDTGQDLKNQQNKNSSLGVASLILSIIGCTFILGFIFSIIDLCKKDGKKKTCSIIALVICGLWFIICVSSGVRNDNDTTQQVNIQNNIEMENIDQSETEESKTDEDLEEVKPEESDKYHVGDTWENKYVFVSYDECGEYTSDNQFLQPADGNKYIYATFTFENIGSSDTTVAYWDFDCYADGYACEGTYVADDAAFSQTLSSGRKITGSVYYEVPEGAKDIEFEYSPNFWTSEKIVFVYE